MDFVTDVSNLCIKHYKDALPKKGKPQVNREWTLLAAVVQNAAAASAPRSSTTDGLKVVAMATGSKCIGQKKMSKEGYIINDSHAEVLARRAFIRYLGEQLHFAYSDQQESIFTRPDHNFKCHLKDGVEFYFFTSHTPCGDASIFPKEIPLTVSFHDESENKTQRNEANVTVKSKDTHLGGTDGESENSPGIKRAKDGGKEIEDTSYVTPSEDFCQSKRIKMEVLTSTTHGEIKQSNRRVPKEWSEVRNNEELASFPAHSSKAQAEAPVTCDDIYRTGAKCVPGGPQDLLQQGPEYHRVGLLRSKPGRGDRTLSMSCSDKIARWNVVGCQGALLSHFLDKPIHLKALIVGKCPYNQAAMERALIGRLQPVSDLPEPYHINVPSIVSSPVAFPDAKEEVQAHFAGDQGKMAPAGTAIIWSRVQCKPLEVSVNGSRQGITSKNLHKPEARVSVCKAEMFQSFKDLVQAIQVHQLPLTLRSSKLKSYLDFKRAATVYQEALGRLLHIFDTWVKKPEEYSLFS